MYTLFRNFTVDNMEEWFYCCSDVQLWLMLVQLRHLVPERFLIFCQHAQEWIFGVEVKWRKQHVALLGAIKTVLSVLVSNLKKDQSAVVLVAHQALEVVSGVHCQERDAINHHRNENRDWHSRKFSLLFTLISISRIRNKLSTSQTSLSKKRWSIYLITVLRNTQMNTQNQYCGSTSLATGFFLAQNSATFAG